MTDEERVLAIIDLDAIAYNMTNIKMCIRDRARTE